MLPFLDNVYRFCFFFSIEVDYNILKTEFSMQLEYHI